MKDFNAFFAVLSV